MRFWTITPEQQAATLTLGVALINFGVGAWQSRKVTTLADPKDSHGVELVRATDMQPTAQSQTRSMKEASK